jgi:hypothetical protein
VELGDGWYPFFTAPNVSTTARTAEMTGEDDLAAGIAYLREYAEQTGREQAPRIMLGSIVAPGEKPGPAELIDKIGRLQAMGVSGAAVHIGGRTRAEWCDNAGRFAADVLSRIASR